MFISDNSFNCKLEYSPKFPALTSYAGLALIRKYLRSIGLFPLMKKLSLKKKGYTDAYCIEAFLLLLCAGAKHISHWDDLCSDPGFRKIFKKISTVDCLERYLRKVDLNFVSNPKGQIASCQSFNSLHQLLINQAYSNSGSPNSLTLDIDASLISSNKKQAQFCYDKYKAYQVFIAYCPELKMILAYEFRDGNVAPSIGYKRIVEQCKILFPQVKLCVRSDSAAYQNDFIDYLQKHNITYFITADLSFSLKQSLALCKPWVPVKMQSGFSQEMALLNYIPSFRTGEEMIFRSRTRNYVAIRKEKTKQEGKKEANQAKTKNNLKQLPLFKDYVYQVIVSNAHNIKASEVIQKHFERCGTVEYCNQQIKTQLSLDKLPSSDFKVNTAWCSLVILSHNLLRLIQNTVLPQNFIKYEIHSLRKKLIFKAAQVIQRARKSIIRFCQDKDTFNLFSSAYQKMAHL